MPYLHRQNADEDSNASLEYASHDWKGVVMVCRWRCGLTICAPLLVIASGISPTLAQPVIDEFVSGAQVVTKKNCAFLIVNFHVRVRYAGHFPIEKGNELRISLQMIDRDVAGFTRLARREGVRVGNANFAGIKAVALDLDQSRGLQLRIQFEHTVAYKVAQIGSFENITVAISRAGSSAICKPEEYVLPAGATGRTSLRKDVAAGDKVSVRGKSRTGENISVGELKIAAASMDEARAAMKKGKFNEAVRLLRKVLKFPENKYSAEAQELVGVTRQKAGQIADARAEYEDYLRRYSSGEGADRVRQRLAGLLTATGAAQERLKEGTGPGSGKGKGGKFTRDDETRWMLSGSLSSFYIRDDSFNTIKDVSTAPNPNADPDAHRTHQNTILSNFDLFGMVDNSATRSKFKLAATEENSIEANSKKVGVSTAFVETTLKESDVTARVGRQSRNTGGVIGRFDGGVVSWQANKFVRLNAVVGSPNWSRFDAPYKDGKYLFGTSIDFGKVLGGLETSLFAIQQNDKSLIDRQAVGAEFRYFDKNKSALATIDYDVHFQQLNAAIFSGSWMFADKSTVTTALDYRKVPYLSSWNALQGQPFLTLYDMLKFNTNSEIRQLAIDRTPTFESAMVGYSRPLSDKFQASVDATVTNLTGTPTSGGVDSTPASGTEYYFSAQLMGSSLFTPGDMFVGALRYANLADSNVYMLDLNTRYPLTGKIRVSPRLRLGYRTGTTTDLKEETVLPSVLLNYMLTKDLGLELEVGAKWTSSVQAGVQSKNTDIFTTVGLRYDFNMEGSKKCVGTLVPCILMSRAATPGGDSQIPFYKTTPKVASAFVLEGGLRYWYSSAKNRYDYYADTTPTRLVSRLSYDDLTAHSGELFFRADAVRGPLSNFFVKGYLGGGAINGGNLWDEDFPPIIDPYSKTQSDTKGQLRYGSVDLGYSFYTDQRFRVGAFLGYHYWFENVDASGCSQVGGNSSICGVALPNSMKVITEQDRWNALRLGGVIDVNLTDRLKWNGEIAYVSTSQRPQDTHYFTFGIDPASGHGNGFQAETVLKYQVTDKFSLGIGGRWWHYRTDALDSFNQLLKYQTDRYGVFFQGNIKLN